MEITVLCGSNVDRNYNVGPLSILTITCPIISSRYLPSNFIKIVATDKSFLWIISTRSTYPASLWAEIKVFWVPFFLKFLHRWLVISNNQPTTCCCPPYLLTKPQGPQLLSQWWTLMKRFIEHFYRCKHRKDCLPYSILDVDNMNNSAYSNPCQIINKQSDKRIYGI